MKKQAIHNRPPNETDETAFSQRLIKNFKHFGRWARKQKLDAWRLYDSDVPRFPIRIEVYKDNLVIWFRLNADDQQTEGRLEANLHQICQRLVPKALDWPKEKIYYKSRRRQTQGQQYQKLDESGSETIIFEKNAKLLVNLNDYLDTGLFLDHRPLRLKIAEISEGKRLLNLFCYTGMFSVHSALAGAEKVCNVDSSQTYLDWSERNLLLNEIPKSKFKILCSDISHSLSGIDEKNWDIIVIDPPTFSRGKNRQRDFDIQRDHAALLLNAKELLASKGEIYFSNNFMKFRLAENELKEQFSSIKEITKSTIPQDCARHFSHRAWQLR